MPDVELDITAKTAGLIRALDPGRAGQPSATAAIMDMVLGTRRGDTFKLEAHGIGISFQWRPHDPKDRRSRAEKALDPLGTLVLTPNVGEAVTARILPGYRVAGPAPVANAIDAARTTLHGIDAIGGIQAEIAKIDARPNTRAAILRGLVTAYGLKPGNPDEELVQLRKKSYESGNKLKAGEVTFASEGPEGGQLITDNGSSVLRLGKGEADPKTDPEWDRLAGDAAQLRTAKRVKPQLSGGAAG